MTMVSSLASPYAGATRVARRQGHDAWFAKHRRNVADATGDSERRARHPSATAWLRRLLWRPGCPARSPGRHYIFRGRPEASRGFAAQLAKKLEPQWSPLGQIRTFA
jgi:hypothetical protein